MTDLECPACHEWIDYDDLEQFNQHEWDAYSKLQCPLCETWVEWEYWADTVTDDYLEGEQFVEQ